jgi:hypothetical protein
MTDAKQLISLILNWISQALIAHYIPHADVSPKNAELGII